MRRRAAGETLRTIAADYQRLSHNALSVPQAAEGREAASCRTTGVFVVKSNGIGLRQITPPGTLIQSGNDGDWSPQDNEIIFSPHVTVDARGSLWVIHADGSGLHEINVQGLACGGSVFTPDAFGCHEPHWSPHGTKIIFAGNSPTTGVNIYTTNADGSSLSQATRDGADHDPPGAHPPSSSTRSTTDQRAPRESQRLSRPEP